MKRILCVLVCLAACLIFFAGCEKGEQAQNEKLTIVATAFPHYDFARQLTKDVDNVEIKMLISPGTEVHSYEPSPSDILAISDCDLFVYNGGESEVWAEKILASTQSKSRSTVCFTEICSPDGYCELDHDDHDDHDEHDEHEHDDHDEHEYDEHVWTLPAFCEEICKETARKLCSIDAVNAAKYNANLERVLSQLSQLDKEFCDIFSSKKRDYIVVADRFPFYHFASYYKLDYHAAYPGCSSSTEPSALVIASLAQRVKNDGVPYVFVTEFSNEKIAASVTENTSARPLTLHSCHNVSKEDFDKGVTYFELMRQNAVNLRKALCE